MSELELQIYTGQLQGHLCEVLVSTDQTELGTWYNNGLMGLHGL